MGKPSSPSASLREAIQAVGTVLTDYLKSGPQSPSHAKETQEKIAAIVSHIVVSLEDSTESYVATCREFLNKVKQVRGMPARIISDASGTGSGIVSSSGDHIFTKFPALLPSIMERFDWCIKTYGEQASLYREDQLGRFCDLVSQLLQQTPEGGSKDNSLKRQITNIKSEVRSLAMWDELFYIYKTSSFPSEVEYIFKLENNPIACVWYYNPRDEQGDYRKTYDHRQRQGHVYAVRGNWAIEKDLMRAGPDRYIDEISRPCQEVGCMCHLRWLYALRELPQDMLTKKGKEELERVRRLMDVMLKNK
jgi:hypothetical protein